MYKVYTGSGANGEMTPEQIEKSIEEEDTPSFVCRTDEEGLDTLLSLLGLSHLDEAKTEIDEAIEKVLNHFKPLKSSGTVRKIHNVYILRRAHYVPVWIAVTEIQ